ncbi:outer membrane beta-barrel protein [Sphingomonas aracearum]|uniref:outer membrane beta-barrel protein n=1 Tax=Sphingomonas aracearum TaxID=2283317 RepID=UPI0015F05969|nr:outer membrane beta-barrel protein [Sphingomonas aracearum]
MSAAVVALATQTAQAQTVPAGPTRPGSATLPPEVSRDVLPGVLERSRPAYDAVGLRVGGFRLTPRVDVSGFYNSNIYALDNNKIDDAGVRIAPDLRLASTWGRHALSVDVSGAINRFATRTIENNESVSGVVSGRLDIDRDTQLVTAVTLARRIQARGTQDEVLIGLTDPVAYRELSSTITGQRRFGNVTVAIGGTAGDFNYEDTRLNGVPVRLGDNNSSAYSANGRILYQLGPAMGLFAQGTYSKANYVPSDRFPDRGSHGFSAVGGVAFGLTRLLTGEIGVGYLKQDFNAAVYRDIGAFNYVFKLDWFLSPLIDIHANVDRTFQRSPLLGSAGIRLDTADVAVNYELLRNLVLESSLYYVVNSYTGLSRRERRFGGAATARYLANRNLSLFATLDAARQRRAGASVLGRDYDRAVISAGARVQL